MLEKAKAEIFDLKKLRWTIISGLPCADSADENALEIGIKYDSSVIEKISK